MNVLKRSATAGVAVVLTGLLAACSSGSSGAQAPPTKASQPKEVAPGISDPKDAAAVKLCDLLSADAASSLGLGPAGVVESDSLDSSAPKSCVWKSQDGALRISITAFNDRSIQDYYSESSEYVDFARLQIAGHPAVRANDADPMGDGACAMFVATKEGQMLGTTSQLGHNETGKVDPCESAKKALESAVPTLPSAK